LNENILSITIACGNVIAAKKEKKSDKNCSLGISAKK